MKSEDVEGGLKETLLPFTIFQDEESNVFDFRKSFLYKYLCYVFQFVDQTNPNLTRFDKGVRKVCRTISILIMWSCFLFKMLTFGLEYKERTADLSSFNTMLLVIMTFTWTFRYVLLHILGIVILARQPNEAIGLTEKLSSDVESDEHRRRLARKLKEKNKTMGKIVVGTLISVTLVPGFRRLIGNFIDKAWEPPSNLLELFITLYTRIVSLPCLFYIVYTALLQVIMIEEFYEFVTRSELTAEELFAQYVKMHRRIERMARHVHQYLSVLIILLIVWGTLTAYSTVADLRKLSKKLITDTDRRIVYYETVTDFLAFGLEVFLLFTIPWYYLGKVKETQENLVSLVCEIRLPENDKTNKPFQQFTDLWAFAKRIEKHQKYEDVGYRALRLSITTLKIVWLTVLAPAFLYLGTATIKGEME